MGAAFGFPERHPTSKMTPSTWHRRLDVPYQMEQRIPSLWRPGLHPEPLVLALGREAAASYLPQPRAGCAFLGRCPAPAAAGINLPTSLGSHSISGHPAAAAGLPGRPGWGFIAFLKLQISVLPCPSESHQQHPCPAQRCHQGLGRTEETLPGSTVIRS